jgi:hypothetical protein
VTSEGPGGASGLIETKVRADVGALVTAHPMGEALAEMAFAIAKVLDGGQVKDLAYAGINRELRETLVELASLGVDDDDNLDAELSVPTEVRDPEDT